MFSQTTKPRNIRTVLKPVGLVSSFPKTGTENMSAATISPPEEQYIYVSYCLLLFCFFFFFACCTFVIQSSKKVL